jgi:hypothetical protein
MLLVPFLLGTFAADPTWWSVLLLVSWLGAYLTSYFTVHWWRTRHRSHRGARFRTPALVYAAVLGLTGAVLVAAEPWLLLAALALLPFEAVAAWFALHGRERSWVAGWASATAASLMAPISYRFAGGTDQQLALELFVICWLAFAGTVLHVKSTIRERDNPRLRTTSIVFHLAALVCSVLIDPWLAIPFGYLLVRSVAVPQHGWRPGRIGAVEVVGATLVLVVPLALRS